MYKKKLVSQVLIIIFCFINSSIALANSPNKPIINILTWWGYLKHPEIIQAAEKECGVQISFDEYYSNDEFLRRWEGHKENYDVIIFSDSIYNAVKHKIPKLGDSELWKQSLLYDPVIKEKYLKKKYPHNIIYFLHSVTGFIWNPNAISISAEDSLLDIFKKAKNKNVIIIDDAIEVEKLIEAGLLENHKNKLDSNILTFINFKKVVQESNVYINNEYSQIYSKPNFAFSFNWIGLAILDFLKFNKKHEFFIHPKLSYISSDLIAQTSDVKGAYCVSKLIAGKKIMSIIQNRAYYFSPYADYSYIKNKKFKRIYENFKILLPKLKWLDSASEGELKKLNLSWLLVKISINNQSISVRENKS